MSRRRPWHAASSIALAAIVAGAVGAAAADAQVVARAPAVDSATLVLAASVNGTAVEEPIVVRRRGDLVIAVGRDLVRLGLTVAAEGEIALSDIPGLRWSIDEPSQTIAFEIADPRPARLDGGAALPPLEPLTPAGWGAILGYDTSVTRTPGGTELAGLLDGSFYTPAGYAFGTFVGTSGGDGRRGRIERLQSGVVFTDPARMRRIVIGDYIPGATAFSRPVRMAGFQYTTDFSLRPDLVTFPVPSIAGAAAVPSAVDLIVNGSRRAAGQVRAGQFSVADIPVQAGVNTVTVAVRDALGRETLQTISTYASRALLRPGLSAVSLEAGAVRIGYGSGRDRYGAPGWSTSVRHGVSQRLTVGGHAEGNARLAVGGIGAALGLGVLGQIDVSVSASGGGRGAGGQFAASFERIGGRTNVVARYIHATPKWEDLASRYGSITRSHTLLLNLGFDLGRLGTLSGGLIGLGRGRGGAIERDPRFDLPGAISPLTLARSRFVTGSYSVRLLRSLSLIANGGADLRRGGTAYASIGVLAIFGARTTGYVGTTLRSGAAGLNTDVGSNAVLPGQFGYRVVAATGAIDRVAGGVEYQSRIGHVAAQVERTAGQYAARASARGSIIVTRDGAFAADSAPNSVAIVDTNGLRGVRVYRDNRFAGATDRNGRLIVTNLNPFLPTKISVEPEEISEEFALASSDVIVRPPERAGVHVRFDLERSLALMLQLVDAAGRPIAAGSRARTEAGGDIPVGLDGAVFLASYQPVNRLIVSQRDGGTCIATFDAPAVARTIGQLGPIRCEPSSPPQR